MRKKILWVFLGVMMIVLGSVSVSIGENTVPEVKSLSLSQAVEIALKENHQVELAGLGVDKANLVLEQAEYAAKNMKKKLDGKNGDQNTAMVIDVVPAQAMSGKVIADTGREYTANNIKYLVEAAYYGVMRGEKMLEVSKASYNRAQEQLKQAQAKFKAGIVAKIDVISAESQLKSAEAAVNEAETGVSKANMSLNKTLGLNLDTPIKLTDKFNFQPAQPVEIEKVLQEMFERDLSYVSTKENYNINQNIFDFYKRFYTSNTFIYRDYAYKFKEAEANYANAKAEIQLNIKSAYLDLKTAEDNYQVLSKSVEQAKEAFRLTKLRYDVGMATGYDVLGAENALKQVELGLLNALYNYNLAKAKFTYGIFGGSSPTASSGSQA